jgi:hypothetical protein
MSLETPVRIRMLQRKLYQKAKGEPSYRFYLLYDKMYREDILAYAYAVVKSNQGAPGVDGQTFRGIETQGLEEWLSGIRNDLRAKTHQPQCSGPQKLDRCLEWMAGLCGRRIEGRASKTAQAVYPRVQGEGSARSNQGGEDVDRDRSHVFDSSEPGRNLETPGA